MARRRRSRWPWSSCSAWLIVLACSRTHQIGDPGRPALVGDAPAHVRAARRTGCARLDPAARERNERWAAFKRWTEDFPRLDDDPPATLKLWRRILVYAVAFGTAERVAKSGRIPAPVAEEAASSGVWTSYAIGAGLRAQLRRLLLRLRKPGRPGVVELRLGRLLRRRWRRLLRRRRRRRLVGGSSSRPALRQ